MITCEKSSIFTNISKVSSTTVASTLSYKQPEPTWYNVLPLEILALVFQYFEDRELRNSFMPVRHDPTKSPKKTYLILGMSSMEVRGPETTNLAGSPGPQGPDRLHLQKNQDLHQPEIGSPGRHSRTGRRRPSTLQKPSEPETFRLEKLRDHPGRRSAEPRPEMQGVAGIGFHWNGVQGSKVLRGDSRTAKPEVSRHILVA